MRICAKRLGGNCTPIRHLGWRQHQGRLDRQLAATHHEGRILPPNFPHTIHRNNPLNRSGSGPGGRTGVRETMLASIRTGTRTATTPHLRWLATQRVHLNPSLACLPRCSFRQLSSGRAWRSPSELAFGTSGAPCVIHSSRFLVGCG